MVSRILKYSYFALLAIMLASCGNIRNVAYINNYESFKTDTTLTKYEMRFQPKDQVDVLFFFLLDQSLTMPMLNQAPNVLSANEHSLISSMQIIPYIIDNEGNIDMPLLGKVHIAGETKKGAEKIIKEKASKYFQSNIDLYVNVSLCNFTITVDGEVERPNIFNIPSQRVNIFEALAMAGDIKITGRKDNVMIIRLEADGTRTVHRLDLTDVNVINSPDYYLQQRDIVYVEPTDIQKQEKYFGNMTNLTISGTSVAVSIGSLLFQILN